MSLAVNHYIPNAAMQTVNLNVTATTQQPALLVFHGCGSAALASADKAVGKGSTDATLFAPQTRSENPVFLVC